MTGVSRGRTARLVERLSRHELVAVIGLLVLAALLRLPDLAARGTWDGDQGHDMLVLRELVRSGTIPLLGPPTSIGDVHHGAWYYYLLSPAAFLTGGDSPLAVVLVIAVAGIAAVGVVWWLARAIGGPTAGLAAGLVIALSAAAIDESTFIWNPNLIALSSAIALAGAWRGWSGGDGRWWVLAFIGVAITMQCHVLGIALLPVIAVPFILDGRRRPLGRIALASGVVVLIAYLPLLVHELTTDFSEVRAALAYLAADRVGTNTSIAIRFGIVGLRVVSWPLVGLITEGFVVAVAATAAVVGIVAWRWRGDGQIGDATGGGATPRRPRVVRWMGLGLLWSTAFLAVTAPSLASVVPGLPNDHYHAFADPMVYLVVGLGVAAAARAGSRVGTAVALVGLIALGGWNLTHLPPSPHPDGGYPAGQVAGDRVELALTADGAIADDVVLLRSLPDFKSTEAVAYPLALIGRAYVAETPRGVAPGSLSPAPTSFGGLVLLCDDRFAEAIGGRCGGPAESTVTPDAGGSTWGPLLDRFEAAPGRFISVYGSGTGP